MRNDLVQHVYIFSMNRSGSTLLSSILNSHSEINGLPESSFTLNLGIHFNQKKYTEHDYQRIVNALWVRMKVFKKVWDLSESQIIQKLITQNPQTIQDIIICIQKSYSTKNARIIVDKNPIYNHFASLIHHLFPEHKKIILIRDYRDRYHSLINGKLNIPFWKMPFLRVSWMIQMKKYLEMKKKDRAILFVKFEDLILDSKETVQSICDFLDLPIEEKMLTARIHGLPDFSNDHTLQSIHESSRYEFDSTQINKAKLLKQSDLKALHFYCNHIGKDFGYQSDITLTWLDKIIITIIHFPTLLLFRISFAFKKLSYFLPISFQRILVR
jgi:hypothetical protein